MSIFPSLEAARPRSKSGIQALCSLHVAPEESKNVLQHCVECSKLYLAITGDSVPSKFEKARCALMDSLRRVEDIALLQYLFLVGANCIPCELESWVNMSQFLERIIAVLINLGSSSSARDEMMSNLSLISALATILEAEQPIEQEQAVSCLYMLCNGSEKCSQMVLKEGVIPAY
ncbi:U-box domain-containing protein 6 [Pyrus ussuriensis x Pyrus communis]|uniref:U-box domain-containing protein 6 n=1 Tax=Pyrus ussuriensis x Pyrus communis TaxID=2448454 RepID=A0A5N5HFP4_9ROSA|nr:U-box domain-containing protein 6 [Pyrus ussuriensis x Pyrus communis]